MPFSDIKGLFQAKEILRRALINQTIAPAYLICGPEGIGKLMLAREFARSLNCDNAVNGEACGRCFSCLKVTSGAHPDVHIIGVKAAEEAEADSVKIEDIRLLQKEVAYRPYEGKKKVFIVDNAHLMTADAAHALLKVLEEPPATSCIILVTAKPQLLFKTIQSRCQQLRCFPFTRKALEKMLSAEYGVENSLAHFLAYFCEGSLGAALKLKDTPEIIKDKNSLLNGLRTYRGEKPLSRALAKDSLKMLASWLRDIYLLKNGISEDELIHFDCKDDLLKKCAKYSLVELEEAFRFVTEALLQVNQNANTRLVLSQARYYMKG